MLLQLINIPCWFPIISPLHYDFSHCLRILVHWFGYRGARGKSEWCILLGCCQNNCFRRFVTMPQCLHFPVEQYTSAPYAYVRLFCNCDRRSQIQYTRSVTAQQFQSQFCGLQDHTGMHLSETARDTECLRWAVVMNRFICCTSQGRVETHTYIQINF